MEQIMYSLPTPEFLALLRQVVCEELEKRSMGSADQNLTELMSLKDCAAYTGFASSTIYSLVSRGQIPHAKKNGRLFFFRTAIEEWIKGGAENKNALHIAEARLLELSKIRRG